MTTSLVVSVFLGYVQARVAIVDARPSFCAPLFVSVIATDAGGNAAVAPFGTLVPVCPQQCANHVSSIDVNVTGVSTLLASVSSPIDGEYSQVGAGRCPLCLHVVALPWWSGGRSVRGR